MGAWTLLQDLTVGTNSTSVVMNDFGTITKDDFIKVVATFVNATSSNNSIQLFGNTATTTTNYHYQQLTGSGSSVFASRVNAGRISLVLGNKTDKTHHYLKLSENDRMNVFSILNLALDSGIENSFIYTTSSGATFTSGITSLTFTGNQTNGIGTGSRIQIYRLDADKVADITVETTTDQVDISSLSIDKDSEYLLVSDIDNLSGTGTSYSIFINDNIVEENYYGQLISGNGSTTSAVRNNRPQYGGASAATKTIIYTYIKLSNIGAFTYQSYVQRGYGTSTNILDNWFGSSTAENITSITKLNIIGATNSIGSGSRFELYKLK